MVVVNRISVRNTALYVEVLRADSNLFSLNAIVFLLTHKKHLYELTRYIGRNDWYGNVGTV